MHEIERQQGPQTHKKIKAATLVTTITPQL